MSLASLVHCVPALSILVKGIKANHVEIVTHLSHRRYLHTTQDNANGDRYGSGYRYTHKHRYRYIDRPYLVVDVMNKAGWLAN